MTPPAATITSIGVGCEPLLIGLRPDDPLAAQGALALRCLEHRTLGVHAAHLFPAWHAVQRQTLLDAGLTPPMIELDDPDVSARRWTHQPAIDWIMLTNSLRDGHEHTTVRPAQGCAIPYTLSWRIRPEPAPPVRAFTTLAARIDPPAGWSPQSPPLPTPQHGQDAARAD